MRLYRLDREVEAAGDLLVAVAARDQLQHLALAGRQIVELGVSAEGLTRPESVEDEAGQARREHRVSLRHALDRVLELGSRDRLRHVATGARADDADHI